VVRVKSNPGKWGVLYMTSFAMFIMTIDMTMMNVSISALVSDLHTTVQGIQLSIALYTLVMAAFMIIGAKLADIMGTKKVFVSGLLIYGIGTTMATFAPNITVLILGWSILEGIGASMMMPVTITYITKTYDGVDRAFAFSVWSAIGGAAAAFGPIIGGFFTTYITWRLGFGMEVLIVIGMFAKMGILRDYPPKRRIKLDVIGAALVATGLFMVTLSILLIDPLGESPVLGVFSIGLAFLFLFFFWERRMESHGKDPLLNLRLFKSRNFVLGNVVSIFFQITLAGAMFTLPIFLQNVAGYSAMNTGLTVLPLSIMMFIFSIYGEKVMKYLSPKQIIQIGILLSIGGLVLLYIVFSPYTDGWHLAPGLALYGTGLGLVFSQITNLTMAGASERDKAEASGVFNSQKQLGMSLGTAFIGAVLVLGMIRYITYYIYSSGIFPNESKEEIRRRVIDWLIRMKQGNLMILPDQMQKVQELSNWALANAMKDAVIFMIISLLIGAVLSLWLPDNIEEMVV